MLKRANFSFLARRDRQSEGTAADLKVTKAEGTASLSALRCSVLIWSARQASLSGQKSRASTLVSVVPYLRRPHMPYLAPTTLTCSQTMITMILMILITIIK